MRKAVSQGDGRYLDYNEVCATPNTGGWCCRDGSRRKEVGLQFLKSSALRKISSLVFATGNRDGYAPLRNASKILSLEVNARQLNGNEVMRR
ncbi:hypothetical protein VTL71DRAFT_12498 [Oculimacula yallundae]|uniref:Uncharacterized protein n=1 Tax=Oculimacula yallundae TaxID=86028 RepID=A0ABR4CNH1_9HELO